MKSTAGGGIDSIRSENSGSVLADPAGTLRRVGVNMMRRLTVPPPNRWVKRRRVGAAWMSMAWLCCWSPAQGAELITRAEWPDVKQGMQLTEMPALRRVVARFDAIEDGEIVIRYPGGDRGQAWALELRDWLVALGVASRHIVLEPGSGIPATMVVHARQRDAGR